MNEEIDKAIKALADKAGSGVAAHEAIHYSQAALNLAHTKQVLSQVKEK